MQRKKRYKKEPVTLKQSLSLAILLLSQEANRADDRLWKSEVTKAVEVLRHHKQNLSIVSKG